MGTAGDATFDQQAQRFVSRLLTCVYQATRNSSQETLAAARTVAEAVGADFVHWNVDALVDEYVATVAAAAGATSRGIRTTWRYKTSKPERGRRVSGCWRTCAARCC